MLNTDRYNSLVDSCRQEAVDVYNDGKYSISRQWLSDDNGRRIPNTTVFAVYEDDDGDFPLFNTHREAKDFLWSCVMRDRGQN